MKRRPEPHELVAEIARQDDVIVSRATAGKIAAALFDYADTAYEVRRLSDRREWEDQARRERILLDLRRQLFDEVAGQGLIPTALPSRAIRYFALPAFVDGQRQSEVPAEFAAQGADYESVEITLGVQCRTPEIDRAAAVRAGLL